MSDVETVINERTEQYGKFTGHAKVAQRLKTAMQGSNKYQGLDDYHKEALEMITHKIARIINGNPDHVDSWVDIAGYAQLVVNELEAEHE